VERGKIVFENGSENYQEAEKELDKNIAKALRQIEQRKRRPYPTGEFYVAKPVEIEK